MTLQVAACAKYWRFLAEQHERHGRIDWAYIWRGRAEALEMRALPQQAHVEARENAHASDRQP